MNVPTYFEFFSSDSSVHFYSIYTMSSGRAISYLINHSQIPLTFSSDKIFVKALSTNFVTVSPLTKLSHSIWWKLLSEFASDNSSLLFLDTYENLLVFNLKNLLSFFRMTQFSPSKSVFMFPVTPLILSHMIPSSKSPQLLS